MRWFMLGGEPPVGAGFLDGERGHLFRTADGFAETATVADWLRRPPLSKGVHQRRLAGDRDIAEYRPRPPGPSEGVDWPSHLAALERLTWTDSTHEMGAHETSIEHLPPPIGRSEARTWFSAPLDPTSGDVIAIGRNYKEHADEMARATGKDPGHPTVFSKAQTAINGPFCDIVVDPKISNQIDWEAELGVVIGFACRDVGPEDALDYVFGYTIVNDVSARDIQYGWGGQYYKGKSIDGYCPIGPWIVTKDEIPDPQNLEISLRVNGEPKQHGSTKDMIFTVAELVSQLSIGQTLRPGTLIATGTPPGVGYAREPKEFLRPGDVMETEITGIGFMRNRIVASDPGIFEPPMNVGG